MKRVPASMRTREELTSLIEGRLSTASAKDALVKLATRLVVEESPGGRSRRHDWAGILRARRRARARPS
jgi:hypothetical protein